MSIFANKILFCCFFCFLFGDLFLDEIDIRILELLQADGRMANADLARELQMAPSAVFERVRKLEQRKVITGFATRVEPKLVGLGLTAFLFVQIDPVKYSEHGHSELGLGERGHSTTAGERRREGTQHNRRGQEGTQPIRGGDELLQHRHGAGGNPRSARGP